MRNPRGFSLMELMIVLVVAGIVIAIGLPAFSGFRNTLALKQARALLLTDIRDARQMAITRRAPVYIRYGTPPSTSDILTYKIHIDSNANGIVDNGERYISRTMPKNTVILATGLAPVDSLCFDISGILLPGNGGGTLIFANSRGKRDTLAVSLAGIAYRP
jgi:prepilin-type N-terminal cleavage/methylation domain-containing protein